MWRYALAALFFAHGVAHLVGFVVPWKLGSFAETPYHTTILSGRIDLGDAGIRVMGLAWLAAGIACAVAAFGFVVEGRWALRFAGLIVLTSSTLCVALWPQARPGLMANVGLAVGLLAFAGSAARADWRATSDALIAGLGERSGDVEVFDVRTLDELPPPVARYFRRVLPDGQRPVRQAWLTQEADFFMAGRSPGWHPLTATQHFSTRPPAFVWDARIQVAPMVSVWVRDAYASGTGSMRADLLGWYPVMRTTRSAELDAGALQRYLAELIWLPTALLPSAGVRWEARGERVAVASLTDGSRRVELEFRFNDTDDVSEIFAAARYREDAGRFVPTPWLVRCWGYQERDGMRIPMQAEVTWLLPDGPQPYWRGRLTDTRYTFSR